MCIIIDTNVLASVFNEDSADHSEFKPVRDWIFQGAGCVVWGGSKYIQELTLSYSYLNLFNLLTQVGKGVYLEPEDVDPITDDVKLRVIHRDFNDQHLVGLLIKSGCKLICSKDKTAYPYFHHEFFFRRSRDKPKIYSSQRNASLLNNHNIAEICKPCILITRVQREAIGAV